MISFYISDITVCPVGSRLLRKKCHKLGECPLIVWTLWGLIFPTFKKFEKFSNKDKLSIYLIDIFDIMDFRYNGIFRQCPKFPYIERNCTF